MPKHLYFSKTLISKCAAIRGARRRFDGWVVQVHEYSKVNRNQNAPLALTHSELRLGKAAWSLICSSDSGGSVYIRLLDLRRLRSAFVSMAALSDECTLRLGGRLTSPAKVKPAGWRSKEDSLAVLMRMDGAEVGPVCSLKIGGRGAGM